MLRIGEPVKVRGCLQRYTLRAQVDAALTRCSAVQEARQEQQQLRRQLRSMPRWGCRLTNVLAGCVDPTCHI